MTNPPKRWLAAAFGLIAPGAGHAYAGAPLRGLAFLIAAAAIYSTSWGAVLLVPSALTLPVVVTALVGLPIGAAADAWRSAGRWPTEATRPLWSRGWTVLPAALAAGYGLNSLNDWAKQPIVAFRPPSTSMEPALLVGDYVFVDRRPPARQPSRGAIVVYLSVEEPGLKVGKRVVGLAGDTLAMEERQLIVNGVALAEPYISADPDPRAPDSSQLAQMRRWQLQHLLAPDDSAYNPDLDTWGPLVVPQDSFFALGDTRNASYDSRHYGFVPYSHIVGRPRYVYFSRDQGGAIRWARLGTRIQ